MRVNQIRFLLIFFFLLLISCSGDEVPAFLPTPFSTTPPTAVSSPIAPPEIEFETAVSQTAVSPTQSPADTPFPTPTLPPPDINITLIEGDGTAIMGQDIVARGRAVLHPNQVVMLSLVTINGRLLASSPAEINTFGWEGRLVVPEQVSGAAYLYATVRPEPLSDEVLAIDREDVHLALDVENADRYLALYRPVGGETAVASFNFFFDGVVYRPTDSLLTISIWMDDCQTKIAEQTFVMNGSGYWQGFIVLPWNVEGEGCAVAHFGTPDTADWREAVAPITVMLPADKEANGVTIASPPPGRTYAPGESVYLYGTAYVSDGIVRVKGELENGRVANENSVTTDEWGYWEYSFRLPAESEGQVEITVSTGEQDDERYTETRLLLPIEPEEE